MKWLMVVIDTIAGELGRVNNGNVITADFDLRPKNMSMYRFRRAFEQLSLILSARDSRNPTPQDQTPCATPPTQTTIPLPFTPPNQIAASPSPSRHKNPSQLPYPIDPQFSNSSTISSKSAESDYEHFSSKFALDYLEGCFESIEEQLDNVPWYRLSGYRIKHRFSPSSLILTVALNNR